MKQVFLIPLVLASVLLVAAYTRNSGRAPASEIAVLESKLDEVSAKLDQLAAQPSATSPNTEVDTSKLSRSSTSDLTWILITSNPAEKKDLVLKRIKASSEHKNVSAENIHTMVDDLESLNVVINAPEHLDFDVLQRVEAARNHLVDLLRKEIPGLVRALDEKALNASYGPAKQLWSESSAVLGFYPSSNDPPEAGKIQQLVSGHDMVRTRIELIQQQRYNLWACQQIRLAWNDFEENSDPGARRETCIHFLGPIHSGLLDPVSLELYRDFLQTIRNKLSKEVYQDLSEKLAMEKRKLLGDL